MLGKTVLVAFLAALSAVEATGLHKRTNWGSTSLQRERTPAHEKQSCSSHGSFLFGFGDRALCSSPNTRGPPPKDILCPLKGWSFYQGGVKCCIPDREQTECDCGEGYYFNKQQGKCVPNRPNNCGKDEWWQERSSSCCPNDWHQYEGDCPKGIRCPSGWYWHKGRKVCKPKHPRAPEPDCDDWNPGKHCCGHPPSHPSPKPPPPPPPHHGGPGYPPPPPPGNPHYPPPPGGGPKPPGGGGHYGGHRKRDIDLRTKGQMRFAQSDIDKLYCPGSLHACSVNSGTYSEWSYECIDPATELESCGGCASTGEGQDCTQIPNAVSVGCEAGSCAIYSCKSGFSNNGTACI